MIGGTGPQGKGLGYRFARHGHDIILGSRAAEKASSVADEVTVRLADVPYDGHDQLVASLPLAGKTVISCVNPLAFDKRGAHGQVITTARTRPPSPPRNWPPTRPWSAPSTTSPRPRCGATTSSSTRT